MSIIWIDGPDHYGTDVGALVEGVYAQNLDVGLSLNTGPGGVGNCFDFFGSGDNAGNTLRWVLPGGRTTVGIGYRALFLGLPTGTCALQEWRDASNAAIATMTLLSTGAIVLNVGGANVATTGPVIVANSWQHIEARLVFGASGNYQINVNGLPVASNDSIAFPDVECAQVALRNSNGCPSRRRDYYVWDDQGDVNNGGMQGDRQVVTSMPTGDGAEQDWQYSSGSQGYPLIDGVPPVDSDFVFADTAGNKSTFDTADISTDITSISAIRIAARAAKSDAGIGTMALQIVSSGDASTGTEQSLSTEFIGYSQIVEKDPHTGTKWTPANLNAARVELERVQ